MRIAVVGTLTIALLLTGVCPGLAVSNGTSSGSAIVPETVETKLGAIDPTMTLADQARVLFPAEPKMQFAFISQAVAVDLQAAGSRTDIHPRALPIALAPFVAVLARCVWGALGGGVVNEVITLVHQGKQADAQSRVYALVGDASVLFSPRFSSPLHNGPKMSLPGPFCG